MKKSKIKTFIFFVFLFVPTTFLYAVPAIPDPVVMTQPDGDQLTVMIKGDERVNWYESMDGYTLLFNNEGYLSYAQLDESGNLQPSNYIATDIEKRDIGIASFLNTIEKNLYYSDMQIQLMLQIWKIEDDVVRQHVSKDGKGIEYKMICALVQFPEKAMIHTIDDFEPLLNQIGYTGNNTGSVRDYFKEVSYNKIDLTLSLFGIYTAPNSSAYYAGNSGTERGSELASWLAKQVIKEADLSEYDVNEDAEVDGFHFIFAGRGQADGGGAGTIWPHKSSISPVYSNGVRIETYSCSNELRSNTDITTIGVICHEMTHGLGAADFYDTNYGTGGQFSGTGNWDLMAAGNYNGSPSGNRPAHPNMYIKTRFGWVNPVEIGGPTTITDMPNAAENMVAYRINTGTLNEYFLLENRQRVKFDSSIPGEGLIIYHVHSSVGGYCINCTHPQRMYPVCANATVQVPTLTPNSYGTVNNARCAWPAAETSQTPAKTEFTDNSTPCMKSWSGQNTGKPITNITRENGLISFNVMKLGIDDAAETNYSSMKIIPNPAHEYIDLSFEIYDLRVQNIEFYNAIGQLVKSVPYNGGLTQRISVVDLGKGTYVVKAGGGTGKVVVQ